MISHNLKTCVEFGNGTVSLTPRLSVEGFGLLGLDVCEPHEIGELLSESDRKDDINECCVILAFKNVASLDVVISDLNRIRQAMVDFENNEIKENE
jgi:hypothetical protein